METHPVTSRSWTTRMASVVRQFNKLMEEQKTEEVQVYDPDTKRRVEVVGMVRCLEGSRYTVVPYGKCLGVYQVPHLRIREEQGNE